jgi:HSP20 family molecular chaperone IbpA
MAHIIPHTIFPRSQFDVEHWFYPTLETFDPFDELDTLLSRNLEWITEPEFVRNKPKVPTVPEKYRITVDCAGYKPKSLKTEIKENKLYVHGKEEYHDGENFSKKEFRRVFDLPPNSVGDQLVSFVAGQNFVIEIPLRIGEQGKEELLQKTVDKHGRKFTTLTCKLPTGIDPHKLNVTCKDRDLIIKAEDRSKEDSSAKIIFVKRCTLPENTVFEEIKCHVEDDKLTVEAPLVTHKHQKHVIPVEFTRLR